jgi:hypothetical protein
MIKSDTNIFEKALIMRLSKSKPGNKKKVSTSQIEVDADKTMLHVSKDILDCPEFSAIEKHFGRLSLEIRKLAVQPSPLGRGYYLMPIPFVQKADEVVTKADDKLRMELLPIMMAAYPTRILESKKRLNGLADPTDYPSAEEFERAFVIAHSFESFGTPEALEGIDPEIYRRELAKAKDRVTDAAEKIAEALTLEAKDLVDRMVERLEPGADGRQKVFRDSLVENLSDFFAKLPIRNITGKAELEAVAKRAEAVLQGVDPESLRQNTSIRNYVRDGMGKVKDALDEMITLKPKRFFQADAA